MVRVNLIHPKRLSDQHLIAEYLEILMLIGYVKKNKILEEVPKTYRLGTGHIKFFKDKLLYLKKRHEELKKEMKKRGFVTRKTICLKEFGNKFCKDWKPREKDFKIIEKRISEKIAKKPEWYRYYGQNKDKKFWNDLIQCRR